MKHYSISKRGLFDKRLLERKPKLKVCSNHFKPLKRYYRIWNAGTAISDGLGWYKLKEKQG